MVPMVISFWVLVLVIVCSTLKGAYDNDICSNISFVCIFMLIVDLL